RAQEFYIGFVVSALGPPELDPARPRVGAGVVDCLIAPVTGARVTMPDLPDLPQYDVDFSSAAVLTEGPTNQGGVALLVNLPDSAAGSPLRVRADWPDAGQTISERAIWVRPGFSAFVLLVPSARSN